MQHFARAVSDCAYRVERPADIGELNRAGCNRPIFLDELDHSHTAMRNRRIVGAVGSTFHKSRDLNPPGEVVRSDDMGACAWANGDVDYDLLAVQAVDLAPEPIKEANGSCRRTFES